MVPMGYYTGKDLPTYEYLAHQFCVCDAWHASVPGDTWPNRLYSLAGREGEKVHPSLLDRLKHLAPGAVKAIENAPIYDVAAFTHHLDDQPVALVLARPGHPPRRRQPLPPPVHARQLQLLRPQESRLRHRSWARP